MHKRDERLLLVARRREDGLRALHAPAARVERRLVDAQHELGAARRVAAPHRLLEQPQRRQQPQPRERAVPIARLGARRALRHVDPGVEVPLEPRRVPLAVPDVGLREAGRRLATRGRARRRRVVVRRARRRVRRHHEELVLDDLDVQAQPLRAARLEHLPQRRLRDAALLKGPQRPVRRAAQRRALVGAERLVARRRRPGGAEGVEAPRLHRLGVACHELATRRRRAADAITHTFIFPQCFTLVRRHFTAGTVWDPLINTARLALLMRLTALQVDPLVGLTRRRVRHPCR